MARLKILGPVVVAAVVLLISMASVQAASEKDMRGAIVKKTGDAASVTEVNKRKVDKGKDDRSDKDRKGRLSRMIDQSLESCFVYSAKGLTAKPAQTHITRSDKARVRAEAHMLRTAGMVQSDLVTYYGQILGPDSHVPMHDKYRVSDRNGPKKTCTPSSN
jgi:hypothetical protein